MNWVWLSKSKTCSNYEIVEKLLGYSDWRWVWLRCVLKLNNDKTAVSSVHHSNFIYYTSAQPFLTECFTVTISRQKCLVHVHYISDIVIYVKSLSNYFSNDHLICSLADCITWNTSNLITHVNRTNYKYRYEKKFNHYWHPELKQPNDVTATRHTSISTSVNP